MKRILIHWLLLTSAVISATYLIDGIVVRSFFYAFIVSATLGILNTLLRPLLIILTLPINILTLGLFTFIINAIMLKIVSAILPGFEVRGFWAAICGALVIVVVNWVLGKIIR